METEATVESSSPTLAERRRQQICDAAVALFAEHGYVNTKIEDISNSIGVGKGLIYRYFQDKQDVLFHALCTVLDKYRSENFLGQLQTLGPLPALRHLLSFHCTQAQLHTQEVILAYRSTKDLSPEQRSRIKALESALVAEIRQCLEACIRDGLMRPFNVDIMAYQVLMFGHTWALKLWTLGKKFTVLEFVAEGEQLLIVPFLTETGRRAYENPAPTAASGRPVSRRAPR
jgi:AcrR family transcriptional regulator